MITLKSCPVCESQRITQYHLAGNNPYVTHEIMPGVEVEAAIITFYYVCQNCRLVFQNPRLSDIELDKYYSQGYYRRSVNNTESHKDSDGVYRAKTDTEIIKQHIGKQPTSHLDIGCGLGYLLEAVGADVRVGVELDIGYVKVKGIEVYPEINKVSRKSFDLVTAIHVLEHVPYPLDFLKKIAKFVGKNGHLVIEVPTWKSKGGPLRLVHLYHFESDVLKLMCAQVGLQVIHLEFTPHLILICKLNNN